ncbi:ImmA/IrrE family metallo-endopeptidase [Janthinobacterium lividum]|uniref:ImmA/IrrE family metallo-endopeptidase n=1 Tax=Janthinobacterium lividum TaxID=29581 RepID=UPI0009B8F46E|nr:ImmA/IrrE family metallo-endopeptidase [Janthinobacterium lividum]
MTVGNYKSGFRVKPLSVDKIREKAMSIRPLLLKEQQPCNLANFVESLENFGITYDIVEDSFLPRGVEASCLPEKRLIYITLSTYDAICRNDERARFTIFHELGHLLLAHSRSFHRDSHPSFPVFENSEWQADQFAAEILMPLEAILRDSLTEAWQLQERFGVSYQAATYRLYKLRSKGEMKNAQGAGTPKALR